MTGLFCAAEPRVVAACRRQVVQQGCGKRFLGLMGPGGHSVARVQKVHRVQKVQRVVVAADAAIFKVSVTD